MRQAIRDGLLVIVVALLVIAVAFQVKTNNLVAERQHDSCATRRQFAFETNRRTFVWRSFIASAADTRLKLSSLSSQRRGEAKINRVAALYWRDRLLPLIHDVPIPPRC